MPRPLRVGIVGPCPPPHGGITRIIANHLHFWQDQPVESWVLATNPAEAYEAYPHAHHLPLSLQRAPLGARLRAAARVGPRFGIGRLRSVNRNLSYDVAIARAIREASLDLLYAHHSTATGMMAVTEARRAGIPSVVVTYGETWGEAPAHRRWRRAIDYTVRTADWIVSTSDHCRRGALARGADPDRSSVVYAGIDLDRFHPDIDGTGYREAHGIPDDAVVISVLGLALRRKLDTFLEAIGEIVDIPSIHILIGGTGADADYLAARVSEIGDPRVRALGFVPEAVLPAFYAATDILVVSPRTLIECMGQSMKEAMACGRSVVGARLGGIPEAIEDGECGLLFEPDDPGSLAAALKTLASDGNLRARMGRRGREIAEEKFHARSSADQTLALFQRLVEPRE